MKKNIMTSLLTIFTIIIYAVSYQAVNQLGWDEGMLFITDFSHPWRAQFNTDFSLHMVLFIIWVLWREESKIASLLCGLGCLAGGLFTMPYLLISYLRSKGDTRSFLLGSHRCQ